MPVLKEPVAPTAYAFCEPVHATTISRIHIRRVTDGLKLGGGIVGLALCGFDVERGWDLHTPVTVDVIEADLDLQQRTAGERGEHWLINPLCVACAEAWRA